MKLKMLITTVAAIAITSVSVFAADGITVNYNSEKVVFPDAQPKLINNRTMVPVRGLFEKMGFNVEWNESLKIATLKTDSIVVYCGEKILFANKPLEGIQLDIERDTMPTISEGRMYLPLRAISQATGYEVLWDGESKTVNIYSNSLKSKRDDIENGNATDPMDYDDLGYVPDEGHMTENAQEYLTTLFDTISEIKELAKVSKDPTLLRLYGLNNDEDIAPSNADYSRILDRTAKIKTLEAPNELSDVKAEASKFAEIIENACSYNHESAKAGISNEEYSSQLNDICKQKDTTSIDFSVVLYTYFSTNDVYFEGIFGEYCLDIMN